MATTTAFVPCAVHGWTKLCELRESRTALLIQYLGGDSILGLTTNAPVETNSLGTMPAGLLHSVTDGHGPNVFRLCRRLDGDLVVQEWWIYLVGAAPGPGPTETQEFDSSGSWTVPPGVTSVQAECWGGGGAGCSPETIGSDSGGGGGGGAYAKATITVGTGLTYPVTVGAGGFTQGSTSTPGSVSWFSNTGVAPTSAAEGALADYGRNATVPDGTAAGAGGLVANSIGTVRHAGGAGGVGQAPGPPGPPIDVAFLPGAGQVWTVPGGVLALTDIYAWGGGGSTHPVGALLGGGGGGGGGFSSSGPLAVTPGDQFFIDVANVGTGGSSTVHDHLGTLVAGATGGADNVGQLGGAGGSFIAPTTGFTGGAGEIAVSAGGGGGGGAAGSFADGNNGSGGVGGAGGGTATQGIIGKGSDGGNASTSPASGGTPGGGAGGVSDPGMFGANGGPGSVHIFYGGGGGGVSGGGGGGGAGGSAGNGTAGATDAGQTGTGGAGGTAGGADGGDGPDQAGNDGDLGGGGGSGGGNRTATVSAVANNGGGGKVLLTWIGPPVPVYKIVTVIESYEPATSDDGDKPERFTVTLPRLSPDAIKHLHSLQARLQAMNQLGETHEQ